MTDRDENRQSKGFWRRLGARIMLFAEALEMSEIELVHRRLAALEKEVGERR